MSPARDLWKAIRSALLADPNVSGLVSSVYDKVPTSPWGAKKAYISRGPTYGSDDGADCIDGQEITIQIDVWSRANDTGTCSDIVEAVRLALHEEELALGDNALVEIRVEVWRVVDDPDPLTTHGIVQAVALIEVPEGT